MSVCSHCGANHEAEDRYCSQCGKQLSPFNIPGAMTTQKALDISDVRYRLGMVYFRKGLYPRALEIWEKILQDRPGDKDLAALVQDARSRQEASEDPL